MLDNADLEAGPPGTDLPAYWLKFLSAINEAGVVLVWDGPAKPALDPGKHGPDNRWCHCDPDWYGRRQSDPRCPLDDIAEFVAANR